MRRTALSEGVRASLSQTFFAALPAPTSLPPRHPRRNKFRHPILVAFDAIKMPSSAPSFRDISHALRRSSATSAHHAVRALLDCRFLLATNTQAARLNGAGHVVPVAPSQAQPLAHPVALFRRPCLALHANSPDTPNEIEDFVSPIFLRPFATSSQASMPQNPGTPPSNTLLDFEYESDIMV